MKAVPRVFPTLLEMICFFSTPTIDVEPNFLLRGGFFLTNFSRCFIITPLYNTAIFLRMI